MGQIRYKPSNKGARHMTIQASRDAEGYLIEPDDWNEDIARELAKEENIELDDMVWLALNFISTHYAEQSVIPDVRHTMSFLAEETDCSKREAKKLILKRFLMGMCNKPVKLLV